MQKINAILLYGFAASLFGCASVQKAEILAGDSPGAAISEVKQIVEYAEKEQSDLLSFKEYMNGREYLKKAELGLSRNHSKDIIVENAEGCPRYCGITITGIHVGPSPAWMQNRLNAIGVRPINNICLLYTSPSPRDGLLSRMPSSA